MFPAKIAASIVYRADCQSRSELANGIIASERDYMSTFSARVRDAWKPIGTAYVYSATLKGDVEQQLGCDTLVALFDRHGAKICLIEAKWPRLSVKPSYRWDALQVKAGASRRRVSHFSDQLRRQRSIVPEAVAVEMFLVETVPGTKSGLLDEFGSTLVLNNDAHTFDSLNRSLKSPWTNHDFWELLAFARKRLTNLQNLIVSMATCSIGTPLQVANGQIVLGTASMAGEVKIPTELGRIEEMGPEICRRLGLSNLLLLELPWMS